MRKVAVYNPATGQVERWLHDHDDIVEADWFPGRAILYVSPDLDIVPLVHHVIDGELVEVPPA